MKLILVILLCILPSCAIFHETPAPVQEAASYVHKFAVANASNVQLINIQYYKAWLNFMKTHGATDKEMQQLTALFLEVAKRTEPMARYGVELSKAVADYLNTPSADLTKIISILNFIKKDLQ